MYMYINSDKNMLVKFTNVPQIEPNHQTRAAEEKREVEHNNHNPMIFCGTAEIPLQLFPHSAQVVSQQAPKHMTCTHTYKRKTRQHTL